MSTSDVSSSRLGPATTLSTASSEAPPAKTASVRNVRCSSARRAARSSSRSSRRACAAAAAGRARRRSGTTGARSSRSRIVVERQHARPGGGELDRQRQPVEPRADRLDVGAVARRCRGQGARPRRAAAKRSRRRRPLRAASSRYSCSAPRCRRSRLVASTFSRGQRSTRRRPAARRRGPTRSCRARAAPGSIEAAVERVDRRLAGLLGRPRASARAPPDERRTTAPRPARRRRRRRRRSRPRSRAASSASRVLPTPPGPVSVTTGASPASSTRISSSSRRAAENPVRRRGRLPGVARARRREIAARRPGDDELEEPLGRLDVLEQMLAEVADLGVVADEVARRAREQHLAAVCRSTDARGARQVDADVVAALGQRGLAGVDPDPHAHGIAGRSANARCAAAAAATASCARANATKNESPCVSTSTPLCSTNASRSTLPVRGQHVAVPVAEAAGELGRPFDVGEEEGDGSGGEAGHDPAAGPQLSRL